MKPITLLAGLVSISSILVSCGTVSEVNTTGAQAGVRKGGYQKVIVRDFSHSPTDYKVKSKVEMATKSLPDAIASELSKEGGFSKVSRTGQADASTLVIEGNIDQYDDGNAAARLLVGFAAGNSNLDASVNYKDGASNKTLGTVKADKNSWALGGVLAATQTADSFIEPVAKKIASEAKAKFSKEANQ